MTQVDLDFVSYIQQRKSAQQSLRHGGAPYAYPGDQRVLQMLGRVTPVKLAVEATGRLWRSTERAQLLDSAVKAGESEFSEVHRAAVHCAQRLQIAVPTVYVAPGLDRLDAYTFGSSDDAYIVLRRLLVDQLSLDELKFVIGRECGHIHNGHVAYTTALYYLKYAANTFVRWIVKPAVIALRSWAQRAELTCDRAGLICCGDAQTAVRTLVKLAEGSSRLATDVDLDEQLERSQGRSESDFLRDHPDLQRRAAASDLFAQTHYYLKETGQLEQGSRDGKSLDWCDARVSELFGLRRRRSRSSPGNGRPSEPSPQPEQGE